LHEALTVDTTALRFLVPVEMPRFYCPTGRRILKKRGKIASTRPEDINRLFAGTAEGFGKLNVVVIIEESLGYISMS